MAAKRGEEGGRVAAERVGREGGGNEMENLGKDN